MLVKVVAHQKLLPKCVSAAINLEVIYCVFGSMSVPQFALDKAVKVINCLFQNIQFVTFTYMLYT